MHPGLTRHGTPRLPHAGERTCYGAAMLLRPALLLLVLALPSVHAQAPSQPPSQDINEGIWQGYDGEWRYTSRLLLQLAEAIPASKYSWRPGPGVRSVSEVYMHIALANFYLLSATGRAAPSDITGPQMEKTVTSKPEVIRYLQRSLQAVKVAHLELRPGAGPRKVDIEGHPSTVDNMYLRILAHANEHMGQLIAYARVNGITPPWSGPGARP